MIWPDSCELPGTLVSGLCKSGLSASEDADRIGEKRNIEAYRLSRGDGRGDKEGGGGGGQKNIWIGGYADPIHVDVI